MASVKIRSASMFVGGKKIGQIEGIDYEYSTGDEAQFGDPGYLGHSDGAGTTKLSASGIMPVAGQDVDFLARMQAKEDFDIALGIVNGKIHNVTMRGESAKVTGSQKAGTLHGSFAFAGGEPTISNI